jgi:hypothetical protein
VSGFAQLGWAKAARLAGTERQALSNAMVRYNAAGSARLSSAYCEAANSGGVTFNGSWLPHYAECPLSGVRE